MVTIYTLENHRGLALYVGKTTRPERRLKEHIWEARKGHDCRRCRWIRKQLRLNRAIKFHVLETVHESQWQERERFWIKMFRFATPKMTNCTDGGDGVIGSSKYVPRTAEWIERIRQSNLGKKRSPEARQRISEAHKGIRRTDETKRKMSLASKGKPKSEAAKLAGHIFSPFSKPVYQLSLEGGIIRRWSSVNHAAQAVCNGHRQPIAIACRNPERTSGGFKWRYCS